jgi:hypothetical protein
MTYPGSSSAETDQAAIPPEANRASIRRPTPQDGAAASDRQDTIQSLENLASSGRPLAELLEHAKHLLRASNPDPNGLIAACLSRDVRLCPDRRSFRVTRAAGCAARRIGLD